LLKLSTTATLIMSFISRAIYNLFTFLCVKKSRNVWWKETKKKQKNLYSYQKRTSMERFLGIGRSVFLIWSIHSKKMRIQLKLIVIEILEKMSFGFLIGYFKPSQSSWAKIICWFFIKIFISWGSKKFASSIFWFFYKKAYNLKLCFISTLKYNLIKGLLSFLNY
jgi:hypothetical protein